MTSTPLLAKVRTRRTSAAARRRSEVADEPMSGMVAEDADPSTGPKVAYVVSRFPRLTETFVVSEAAAVLRAGARLELHPIHRERTTVVQPAAAALASHVHYHRLLDRAVLRAQVGALVHRPGAYLGALGAIIRYNWGSRRLLVGGLASFPLAVSLARQFDRDGVEHVHAHFATHPAAVAYVVHRLTGIPFSFTAHGSDLHRDQHMLAQKVKAAKFVVAISEYNRQVIANTCGDEAACRVVVVRCGVDAKIFAPRQQRTRPTDGVFRATCVGTLHEVKGQAVLLEATRVVRTRGHDVEVTFIGDGVDGHALRAQAEALGIADAVRFLGPLTQPDVRAVMERSDVLVAPSVPSADGRREGLPVVVLEAMAVGVPVIASRLSGIPEAVHDGRTGILVEPGDVDGLASAVRRLERDPVLASRLALAARRLVTEEFDLDGSARRLVDLFRGEAP